MTYKGVAPVILLSLMTTAQAEFQAPKTVADGGAAAAKFAIDCSVAPKIVFTNAATCKNKGKPLTNAAFLQITNVPEGLPADAETDALKKKLAEIATQQVKQVIPKINDFLAMYCSFKEPMSEGDLQTYIKPEAIELVTRKKFVEYAKKTHQKNPEAFTGLYFAGVDKVFVVHEVASKLDSTLIGHEFLHRILFKKYPKLELGWQHALIEGNPMKGFLGWAPRADSGELCIFSCEGYDKCSTNESWSAGSQPAHLNVLCSSDPQPLVPKDDNDVLGKQADHMMADLQGQLDAMKKSGSATQDALDRPMPVPVLSDAYKKSQDPNTYNNADPSKQGMSGGVPPPPSE